MPVDPDVGPIGPRLEWDVVLAVAIGGVAGAEVRYGLGLLAPHRADQFPWLTLLINAAGCVLIGVLLAALAGRANPPRLARPLLGTGLLGGFTTFSTFSVELVQLLDHRCWGLATGYLFGSVVACVVGVGIGTSVARR